VSLGFEKIMNLQFSGILYASVVVSAFNRLEALKLCLMALSNQTINLENYEIIVVDDCSTDGTTEYINKIIKTASNIKYIRHDVNQGLASARNSGIVNARGEYIIFLDGDIIPEPNFIENFLSYHAKYPDEKIAVIGNLSFYKNLTDKNNIAYFVQSRYLGWRTTREIAKIDCTNLPHRFFAGGIASIPYSTVMEVGLFDSTFKYYGGEDTDYGIRLGNHRVRLIYGDSVKAYHNDPVYLEKYKNKRIEAAREGFKIMLKKHPGCYDNNWISLLTPVDKRIDTISIVMLKSLLKLFFNQFNMFIIEYWLKRTNKYRLIYSSLLYKLAVMGWTLKGLQEANKEYSSVWK
jgi:glycosyltransferase involved in cell wall biosynthesis